MNMKYTKAGIVCLLAFLIQTSFLNLFAIAGRTPNLLLCMVVVLSFLYENEMYGVVYGAVFGLLYDLCFGAVIGSTALSLVLVSIFILIAREYANIENIANMWIVATASILIYYATNWVMLHIAGEATGFLYMLKNLPIVFAYSFAVITVAYVILIRKAVKHRKDRYFR